jgi:pimeloyl-ACP methyl ester carboxylesterase
MRPHVLLEDISIASIAAAKVTMRQAICVPSLRSTTPTSIQHSGAGIAFWLDPDFRRWNIEDCLPRISCPVIAMQGEDDEYGTMEQLARIGRQVADVELLTLKDCRHSPHRDQPEAVIEAITFFVERITA